MKKNFKKSKFVILPALATLVLTGVASVTGTVAWFTANRAVTATAGNFEARGLNGDFKIQATAGVGTTVTETAAQTSSEVKVADKTLLADASYDINSDILYTKVLGEGDNGAAAVTGFKVIGADGKYATLNANNLKAGSVTEGSTSKTVYYALTWSYTFTYTFTDTTKKIDLFLDSEGSSFKSSTDAALADVSTGKGFRVGFMGDKKTILSADDETKHVTGTELANVAENYTTESNVHYLTAGSTNAKATDGASGNTSRADYLGTFEPTTKTTISLNVIAWFEGTDTHVVNDKTIEAVKGSFNFYVREGEAVTPASQD